MMIYKGIQIDEQEVLSADGETAIRVVDILAENAELRRRGDKMAEALRDASLQIEYLGEKFSETGTGNATLLRIHAALREWDAAKGA